MKTYVVLVYGALMIGLGVLGFATTHSIISLVMGTVFGSLLVISALWEQTKKTKAYSSLALTSLLTAVFISRYLMTGKLLSASLAILSGAVLLYLLTQVTKWKGRFKG